MASPRSVEVKVGVLILTALGLLAAFILVLGGVNFQPTYSIYVDFDNPGGLQSGAPVKIAGIKVGKISEIGFRGGGLDPATGKRDGLVRMKVEIEKRYRESVHDNAIFYVTNQSVLGEQFLAIEPGSAERPLLPLDKPVRGLDPPRLDMLNQAITIFVQMDNIRINFQHPEAPFYIRADRDQLLRCFNNLLKNAIEATQQRNPGIIDINYVISKNNILLSIKDNGNGIPEQMRDKIFEPNFTTKSSGTGLGLAFVKNSIENADGRVWFETIQGVGTTFYLSLPAAV